MRSTAKINCFNPFLSILLLTYQFILIIQASVAASSINEGSFALAQNIILPTGATSFAGYSARDFNGDGFEDIALSFQGYNFGQISLSGYPYSGSVYVIFGTSALLNINLNTLSPSQGIRILGRNDDWLASAIAFGDINHDGIDDLILGVDNNSRVYVIFGKKNGLSDINLASLSPSQGILITGVTSSRTGLTVSNAGDFNDDGIEDFMIAAPYTNVNQGVVYVIFGSSSISSNINLSTGFTSSIGIQILGSTGDYLGLSLNKAGDVNKDGIDDIIIGTPRPTCASGSGTCGMMVIIYGSKTPTLSLQVNSLTLSQGVKIIGGSGATIGSLNSISSVGDLNNDGVDDLAFGAPSFSPSSALISAGLTYIVYGKAGGFTGNIDLSLPFEGFTITGNVASGYFGQVMTAGDMNHDGLSDLIIGSPTITGLGTAYIFFGNKNGFSNIDLSSPGSQLPQVLVIDGIASTTYLGLTLSLVTDFNNDGVNDIALFGQTKIAMLYGSQCGSPQCSSLSSNPICYASAGCACGQFNLYFQEKECVTQCSQGYSLDIDAPICEPLTATPILAGAVAALTGAKTSASIATLAVSFISFGNPGPIVILSLSQVFVALKLLKINYPSRLAYLLQNSASQASIFSKITSPPDTLINHIPSYPLDEKFEEAGFDSSFLVNFWPDLISLVGIMALVLLDGFINSCVSPSKINTNTKAKRIALWLYFKLKQAVKWNLLISIFTGYYGDISLFTSLQMKAVHFGLHSVLEWISLILCVLTNIAIIALQIVSLKVVLKLRKAHHQSQQKNNPRLFQRAKRQLEGCEVLFGTFKENNFLQQSFIFIFGIKIYLFWAAISYFPNYPLIPTLFNSIIGLFMMLYLVLVRPHKEKVDAANFITAEIICEIMNICVLLLALDEIYTLNLAEARATLGDIIIVCNCIFMGIVAVFSATQILFILKDLYRSIKKWIRQRNINSKGLHPKGQSPLDHSITHKNKSKSHENLENSHSLDFDPSMNQLHAKRSGSHFERSRGRQFRRNQQPQGSLAVYQNQDDSEIIQMRQDGIDNQNKLNIQNGFDNNIGSQAPKVKAIKLSGKISTHFGKKLCQRTNDEFQDRDRGEVSNFDSINTRKTYRGLTQLSPAKIIRTRRLDNLDS